MIGTGFTPKPSRIASKVMIWMLAAALLPAVPQAVARMIPDNFSQLAAEVYTVERIGPLAEKARQCLQQLGIDNVQIKVSDGGYGWPEQGPYDGIIVTAAAPEIPAPLKVQLKDEASLVVPIGPRWQQELIRVQRRGEDFFQEKLAPVAFVPLIGEHGWSEDEYYN